MRTLVLFFALVLAPSALAVDLLPSEVRFGETEARLLVRSTTGGIDVRTEPTVLAAGVEPGGEAADLSRTPRALEARFVWRGIDGIVEVVLRREDPRMPVDVIVEDGAHAGVWLEWPARERSVPAVGGGLLLGGLIAFAGVRRGGRS